MSTVPTIRPQLRALKCPAQLADLPAWVIWRYEYVEGEEKPRKVAYYVDGTKRHGRQGRPEDRAHMATFLAAKTAAARRGFDGVGFCPLEDWGIVALDFDACVTAGQVLPEVERLCAGTYAELSPSGSGVRAFFRGNLGNRKSHQRKGWPFGLETFSTKGFVTVTGEALEITDLCETHDTVADLTPEVRALYEERFGDRPIELQETESASTRSPLGLSERQLQDCLEVLDPGMDYDEWIKVGMAIHHETSGHGFELWNEWSSGWPNYPGDDALKSHWNSFGRTGGRVVTANWLVNQANGQGAHVDITALRVADFEVLQHEQPASDDGLPMIEAPQPEKKGRFQLLTLEEFVARPAPEWLVKDVIPDAELAVIFGEPGSGKTFQALDLAMAVARGVPWRGRRVKQGKTVYICAEGAGGFRNRLRAYLTHHNLKAEDLGDFRVIAGAPNFMNKEQALEVARLIRTLGRDVRMVVVDTWAQVTPGANENSGEDMGTALAHCKGIRIATGATVLLITHSGKDASRGVRGWSGLNGAADAVLEVSRFAAGRVLRITKMKDGEDGLSWGFELDVVNVGVDEELNPITSCVVRELQALPVQQVRDARKKLGKWEQLVVEAFTALCDASGETHADCELVIDKALELAPPHEGKGRDIRRQQLQRYLKEMAGPWEEGKEPQESTGYRVVEGRLHAE